MAVLIVSLAVLGFGLLMLGVIGAWCSFRISYLNKDELRSRDDEQYRLLNKDKE